MDKYLEVPIEPESLTQTQMCVNMSQAQLSHIDHQLESRQNLNQDCELGTAVKNVAKTSKSAAQKRGYIIFRNIFF